MRVVPSKGLRTPEEISDFLSNEIIDLQNSGDGTLEVMIGIQVGGPGAPSIEEHLVTLKMDTGDDRTVTVVGLMKKTVRVPVKKSSISPVQFLRDEIGGTFQTESF